MNNSLSFIFLTIEGSIKKLFKTNYPDFNREEHLFNEGKKLLSERKFKEALEYYTLALATNQNSAYLWLQRAKCSLALNKTYGAICDCKKSLKFNGRIYEAHLVKGRAFLQLKYFGEAYKQFDKAITLNKDHAETYRWRGIALQELGYEYKALLDLQKAVTLGDEDANYMLMKKQTPVHKPKQ